MTEKLCRAKTRKGEPCRQHPIKNARYCYIHSFGKTEGVPFWKNSTVHFVLPVILTIAIFSYTQLTAPKKESQQKILKESEQTHEAVNHLIALMRRFEQNNYGDLIKKYPLGYILFGIDHQEVIIPYDSPLRTEIEIDWNQTKILKITKEWIGVEIPSIITRLDGRLLSFTAIKFMVEKTPGELDLYFPNYPYKVRMYYQLIIGDPQGFICLLGFEKISIQSGEGWVPFR